MGIRLHEVHAATVHAPLALLPAAAAVDLAAAITGDRAQARLGRTLWWAGAGTGLLAGLGGLAASQEVRAEDQRTSDMIWLHGVGNFTLLLGALGIAAWRTAHRPSIPQAVAGLVASAASMYTAYLGGSMVYQRGVGVGAMPGYTDAGVEDSPPLFSRRAPGKFARDVVAGLRWLFSRGRQAANGRLPVPRESFGFTGPELRPQNNL
jgi:uncharacterized membrane protein